MALVTLAACAHVPANITPRPRPGPNTQVADYVTHINSSSEWEHSQWYRPTDPYETTGFFVVSMAGSICLDQSGAWVIAHHGELYQCGVSWRAPLGPGGKGSRLPSQ